MSRYVCKNCGKSFATTRGYDASKRRCSNLAAGVGRALGPTPGKSEAKRLAREAT